MNKRNTRIDDAGLSDAEQANLARLLSAKADPDAEVSKHIETALAERRKPRPKVSKLSPELLKAQEEVERLTVTIERLQSRLFRTCNALQKLERRRKYYQKKAAPQVELRDR